VPRTDTTNGSSRHRPSRPAGAYGAGDSFAAALTYYLAAGLDALAAAERASHHGAAVVASLDPLAAQLALP
jgi:ribokinase